MDLGLSLGISNSSTVAADNSGIQILGGGIQSNLSSSGNSASTTPTSTNSAATAVGAGSTPAQGNPNSQPLNSSSVQPQAVSLGTGNTMIYLILAALAVFYVVKRG